MKKGMGSHQSGKMDTDAWLTPKYIIDALGVFNLDPCTPEYMPWKTADTRYTIHDDGLKSEWFGRVWLNPPYGLEAAKWLNKLAFHGHGIALIFARTETKMFFDEVWNKAYAVLFLEGRLYFHLPDGTRASANAGAPSCLIAYSEQDAKVLSNCSIKGKYIKLK